MTKKTCESLRNRIANLAKNGTSSYHIAKITGVSQSTAYRIAKVALNNANETILSGKGRPHKLDEHDERYICRLVSTEKCGTAVEIQQGLRDYSGIIVSTDTILRTLRRNGFRSRLKKKRPQLKKSHRRSRREFELSHRDWTSDKWDTVIWSDETKICLSGSDGRDRCFRKDGEPLRDRHVIPTQKFGGGSIMLWGCMSSAGVGYLARIDGSVNADMYRNILNDELLSTLDWYGLDKTDIMFQQDNAPCHTASTTLQWFRNHGISVMTWPAQSPDLSPIEHLWDRLKRRVRELPPAANLDELWERVQDAWNEITPAECKTLVDSMPKRLAAVRAAKGGYTRY